MVGMSAAAEGYEDPHGEYTSLEVDFDNFSVVPEPATLALLLVGGLALLRRRRWV